MHRSVPAVIGAVTALTPTGVAVTATAEAATHGSTSATTHTYRGTAVNTRFGIVQVAITVSGRRVVNVSATLPTDRPRSKFINGQAGPRLRAEALAAQSAKIQKVSGATVTSQAYDQSLQAALTAGHV
jgi:uncharacterized protein with FMN-binding domain